MTHTVATEYQFIEWHAAAGAAQLTLRRPPLNILSIPMLDEIGRALEDGARDEALRVLVVRADPALRVFSAGVDVADHSAERVDQMIPRFDRVCAALAAFPAPTVAAVHGHALGGGCEIAMCCDLILAAEGANFGQPEIKLATLAPVAALRLPGLVGYQRAAGLLFTGQTISAVDAVRIGLANRAVPSAELEAVVAETVAQLQPLSAAALRLCKRALRLGSNSWSRLADMEHLYLAELLATADAHEGIAAFIEKRTPVWRHR